MQEVYKLIQQQHLLCYDIRFLWIWGLRCRSFCRGLGETVSFHEHGVDDCETDGFVENSLGDQESHNLTESNSLVLAFGVEGEELVDPVLVGVLQRLGH